MAALCAALALAFPGGAFAQQSSGASFAAVCAALDEPSGLYRTSDDQWEARWSFTSPGDTARPGDAFLAEQTHLPDTDERGPGPHYVLYGVIGPDCATLTGKWRALFAPDGERLMTGDFSAEILPGRIVIAQADDDPENPHGLAGPSFVFVEEPDPPVLIVFADALTLQGQAGRAAPVALEDELSFTGAATAAQTVALSNPLTFTGRRLSAAGIDIGRPLAFSGVTQAPSTINVEDTLIFSGKAPASRNIDIASTLAFSGEPLTRRTVVLAPGLAFTGQSRQTSTVTLPVALNFSGVASPIRTVMLSAPLEFRRGKDRSRNITTAELAFSGATEASLQTIDLVRPLEFSGLETSQRAVALVTRLVFPGDTAAARAAVIASPADPAGAGPCGALIDESIAPPQVDALIPQAADDVIAENIEALRAALSPYAQRTADALDAQADCMQRRLVAFEALTALSPHDRWAQNPAFDGQRFYTDQIKAVRNAALYARQVAWELDGIAMAMADEETFYIFDTLDDPEAMKFGLVTGDAVEPAVTDGASMRKGDFELLQKHAESDATALMTQRNRYFLRKIAQRMRYLDALMARTAAGLADWTTIENHLTRSFMPRVASAIGLRINELKAAHDNTAPPTAPFIIPAGEFDTYFEDFARLTQTRGPKIGNATFRDFMNNKVWYGEYDQWPDASVVVQ
ncbi:MAG: hypothetical protein AAF724_04540 [Pseudomonadota bacterium]